MSKLVIYIISYKCSEFKTKNICLTKTIAFGEKIFKEKYDR